MDFVSYRITRYDKCHVTFADHMQSRTVSNTSKMLSGHKQLLDKMMLAYVYIWTGETSEILHHIYKHCCLTSNVLLLLNIQFQIPNV